MTIEIEITVYIVVMTIEIEITVYIVVMTIEIEITVYIVVMTIEIEITVYIMVMTIGNLSSHSDAVRLVPTVPHWWRTVYVKCIVKKVAISVYGSETSASPSLWYIPAV
ncbi:hypothetical protein AVEN_114692-1 [Araneus ventricosus]|uniref:Uncharacterized protein n=1 Tax=Araneus ventricosus TaxID=182803 RepID=A0A4Y2MSA5_ARAVE|nr:hypothetical protein AVEN_114692-1 [Araneus ventricosus]